MTTQRRRLLILAALIAGIGLVLTAGEHDLLTTWLTRWLTRQDPLLEPTSAFERPATPSWASSLAPSRARPNVILAVYDARRRDDFSFGRHGNRRNDTPFLARLSREGILFDNAVSPGCWTIPVHASLFSGLTPCELGIERYHSSFSVFDPSVMSLADVLRVAGYRTVAYADHPFFYGGTLSTSLVRGFDTISVINDFIDYRCITNVGDSSGRLRMTSPFGERLEMTPADLSAHVRSFNEGTVVPSLDDADQDPVTGALFPRLSADYAQSPYFAQRYGRDFDDWVFRSPQQPYFLFLNLHMCTLVARPDPRLLQTFWVRALMLNATRLNQPLSAPRAEETVDEALSRNWISLGLSRGPFEGPNLYVKQVFDNRFYDESFRSVCEYLEKHQLLKNTVIIATSDHGMVFDEHQAPTHAHVGMVPYEHMIRVPLVMHASEDSPLSALHGRPTGTVSLLDLFRTITDLALGPGVLHREQPIRGRSLVERVHEGVWDQIHTAESTLLRINTGPWKGISGHTRGIVGPRFKLVTTPHPYLVYGFRPWPEDLPLGAPWTRSEPPPRYEALSSPILALFDLESNPEETRDVADAQRGVVRSLLDQAGVDWRCQPILGSDAARPAPTWDEDAVETLRALGYIE